MAPNPLQSAWLRFLQKFGVAFLWALVFASLFGGLTYFRLERSDLEGDPRWHVSVRLWFERLEWLTYDWRARQLGAVAKKTDQVVLVAVDDETLANAREAEKPDFAVRPWPRDLTGAIVEQIMKEGAGAVLLDLSVADVSAHQCTPCKADSKSLSDDQKLAARLGRHPDAVVIAMDWSAERPRLGDKPLTPFVVKAGEGGSEREVLPIVQKVLEARTTASLVNADGGVTVWAAATTEARAKELSARFDPKGVVVMRPKTASDDESAVDSRWLALRLASVTVKGLDASRLPLARSFEVPVPELLSSTNPPAVTTVEDGSDGVVRTFPLLVRAKDESGMEQVLASAPLLVAMRLVGSTELTYESGILRVGNKLNVPMDEEGQLLLKWDAEAPDRLGHGSVKRAVPAWRLVINREDEEAGVGLRHHDNELGGRVVVFQDERADEARLRTTPIGNVSHGSILAQALAGILASDGITRVDPKVDLTLVLAFALAGGLLAVAWSSLVRRPGWLVWALTLITVAVLHGFVARQIFIEQHRWVAMVAPLLALSLTFLSSLGYASSLELGLRDFVQRALGGAVRADVFLRVERDLALMQPERRDLTIYFSDIEGFTAVAQTQEPDDVVKVLREYLDLMTDVVLVGSGHVDKYLGDGMMAFWGAPVRLPGHVDVACKAALAMHVVFEKHRAAWEKACGRPLVMRAGLDMGPAVVGEMGTHHRINYTVMGDPVATSARLEQLAKQYGVRILVTEAIVKASVADNVFRRVDIAQVGRVQRELFELVGDAKLSDELKAAYRAFDAAVGLFREGKLAEALTAFQAIKALEGDGLLAWYVTRCQAA